MSVAKQCPSTIGKDVDESGIDSSSVASGKRYWRSLEDFAQTEAFDEFLHREFPAGASELAGSSRRTFLQLMGASLALAGAGVLSGCRRPNHKILPYSRVVPEEIVPGKPLFYATSMPMPGGGVEGLLIETHEGRPTKVEGNPLHPVNQGKSSAWSQASVLDMYDPDRRMMPIFREGGQENQATWDDFKAWSLGHFAHYDANSGMGLAFLVDKVNSPTRDRMRDKIKARWPKAEWVAFDACDSAGAAEGSGIAFKGKAHETMYDLTKARVIVSIDRDFLDREPMSLVQAREFASSRRLNLPKDQMSRLYAVESGFSSVGGMADHRLRLAQSRLPAFVVALAKEILANRRVAGSDVLRRAVNEMVDPAGGSLDTHFIEALAKDLMATENRGRTVLMVGASQPASVHALVHAMNAVLGNVGNTVFYSAMDTSLAANSASGIAELSRRINAGGVSTLVVLGCNPVFNAPGDLGFAQKYASVKTTISYAADRNETGAASTWQLDAAHYLESWGDLRAPDGTISPIQPMIAPLYGSLSDIELLDLIATKADPAKFSEVQPDGFALVQETWRSLGSKGDFGKVWKRALHDGVLAGTGERLSTGGVAADFQSIAKGLGSLTLRAGPGEGELDVLFTSDLMYDGRYANNGWIQELPRFGTRVVWDNPVLVSPATAQKLKVAPEWFDEDDSGKMYTRKVPMGRMAKLTINGRSLEVAVWIQPGMADDTIVVPFGGGREVVGRVGVGSGFNTFGLRDSAAGLTARGATLERLSRTYPISSTQNHWALEERTTIVRSIDHQAWNKWGEDPFMDLDEHQKEEMLVDHYGRPKDLNFAERMGEEAHTPANVSIYKNPMNDSLSDAAPGSIYSKGQQWAMSIDLGTCTGCGVCTIACQSENNIPIVGKKEVRKGREMSWIRVDRYFTGDDINSPDEMYHQPVACQQCENAPCETVCPVNATMHGPEGINYMVYNRCIGTRYCANNCPYKVRRFNFFDYGVAKFNGDYLGKDLMPGGGPDNVNLIPPRLRERLDEIEKMRMNPDVTVRSRGVMEKCSFCIQRISAARVESKLQDMKAVPDGIFQSACQQACPSDAIVFGDMNDTSSKVHYERNHQLNYRLLGFLDTRPRLTYKVAVRNPNPNLRTPIEDPFGHGSSAEHESGGQDGQPHDSGGAGDGHSFRFDKNKKREDRGYAMSLSVISTTINGVHA